MPLQKTLTLAIAAPVANGVCLSQKPAAGGLQHLVLNGSLVKNGVAVFDSYRGVEITSTGDESALTFIINGTNYNGNAVSEVLVGPDATSVNSVNYYSTVTSITVSGNTTGNITVGTNGNASSPWYPMNYNRYPVSSQICNISPGATLNYTVQYTGDNLQAAPNASVTAVAQNHQILVNQSASAAGDFISGVCGVRIILNSWTSGSVNMSIIQSSNTCL